TASPLANLDLYLMPAGATRVDQAVWSSVAREGNIEHIFFRLPAAANQYEVWVRQTGETGASYALAWWGAATAVVVTRPGDDFGGGPMVDVSVPEGSGFANPATDPALTDALGGTDLLNGDMLSIIPWLPTGFSDYYSGGPY